MWYFDLQQMLLYFISFLIYSSQSDMFYIQRKTYMHLLYIHIEKMKT